MDFGIPKTLRPTLETIRAFVEEELVPLEPRFLAEPFSALAPILEAKRVAIRSLGLFLPQIPKPHGMGLGLVEFALVGEILGRSPLGHYAFGCQAPDAGNMEVLLEFGTDSQKHEFLEPLLAGRERSCFALTEPDYAGSNPTRLGTRAVREGGSYVLNGHKWFATAADGALFAIVTAVTDPEADAHRRASQLIVPLKSPGVRLVRNIPVMGHTGDGWASHAELRFENVRVPEANLLGREGEGFAIAQARLGPGRIHHAMRWIGIGERALDLMLKRAVSREIAAGEALARRQTVQSWIAESRASLDAARLLVLQAAWQMDLMGSKAARREISQIKFLVARVMHDIVDRAVQIHGAQGLTDDTILAFFYRQERAARIYDGPDEVHKDAVARMLLREAAGRSSS